MMSKDVPWRNAHRIRLHQYANNRSLDSTTYLRPDVDGEEAESVSRNTAAGSPLGTKQEMTSTRDAMDFFFDMKLAGGPIQCSAEDGTCEEMG